MTESTHSGPAADATSWVPNKPTGARASLMDVLGRRDPTGQLARTYWAAVLLLAGDRVPDHLCLAGHAMRELMDIVPRYGDFLMTGRRPRRAQNIIAQAQELRQQWNALNINRGDKSTSDAGEITLPLKFHRALRRFFADPELQTKNERTDRDLMLLDPSGQPLPEQLQADMRNRWRAAYDFFSGTSHHHRPATIQEFEVHLTWIEGVLLDRLKPRTFENQAVLDSIIDEAEKS